MQSAQSLIGDDLERASSLAAILCYYIEDHVKDQHLLNVSIGLSEMLSTISAKYTKQMRSKI